MDSWIYEVECVNMVYKKGKIKANEDISFLIQRGEILGVLGPNGAGKSTLIKQLVGHLKPTEGQVLYNGLDVYKQTRVVASEVSYYAQEPHALSALTAMEALVFTGQLRGMQKKPAEREARELLERFEMTELGNKSLKRLSGGQKRMVGIGTALIGHSPVLILDEPTNELDPAKRRLVWDLIQEHNRNGATIILVTHNVLEAEHVVDRVAVINHGKLLAIDSVAKLKQRVDQRLKFEIQTAFGQREEVEKELAEWGILQRSGENRICLLVDKAQAGNVLDRIISRRDLKIEEYAVLPPSLEDVYFHIDQAAKEVMGA
ncbi:ABC transporter ATP-binding protein [Paenibacillus jilunlii]|uniref:ABC transporter n=1 Tax=Paenibacillus jilunlii TaxID=682956 RepID=A0A1G9QUQ1_9BACL|nr:ABC transporter ATP-binding protein [Paenibacillus jilunlii]KWX74474.1 ABC transporter [Paenibacillus jilunlii]SDM14718.1 ABC-2 type transport system ATP-binding protein [Paenibacillus jilunlii]